MPHQPAAAAAAAAAAAVAAAAVAAVAVAVAAAAVSLMPPRRCLGSCSLICRSWPAATRILTSARRPCPLLPLPPAFPQGGSPPCPRRSRHRLLRCNSSSSSNNTRRSKSSSSSIRNLPLILPLLPPAPQAMCLATGPRAPSTAATSLTTTFNARPSHASSALPHPLLLVVLLLIFFFLPLPPPLLPPSPPSPP